MRVWSRSAARFTAFGFVAAFSLLPVGAAWAQSAPARHEGERNWTPSRTPDGQPDIQGTWVNFDSTPFEAPGVAQVVSNPDVNPPAHWGEGNRAPGAPRRSMVVDPPDGHVPVLPWAEAKRDYDLAHIGDSWIYETPWVRCITRGFPAGMFPAGYNNAYQIMQVPGFVVMVFEMIHETRIIPIDGRPHVGSNIQLWNGDSRGRWEGNTLVVETTNFNDKGSIATSAATGRMRAVPQTSAMRVVERFTPVDANTIAYQVTIEDSKAYAKPWTVALPLNRDEKYEMFEYACHEGNLSIPNELTAGRAQDATK
jgi:hypothetical protein